MASEQPAGAAIVFSCDEGYVFLARGLVLSLAAAGYPNADTKLILIDIGCLPESLSWMKEHGVEIVPFDPSLIPKKVMAVIKPVQRAQVVRPWLPIMLPHIDQIIWLDCDLWLQNGEIFNLMRNAANIAPQSVIAAPGNSHYYVSFYVDIAKILAMQRGWYADAYEPDVASKAAIMMHYSSGVFSIRRSSPLWHLWRQEIEYIYPILALRNAKLVHLAEQIALNMVMMRTELIIRLDPLYNFQCNAGGALRLDNGLVVTDMMLPSQEIGVIHLANWSFMHAHYVAKKLLYRGGDYLTDAERARLAQ